ncbi:MAG: hypothetical protein AB7V10_01565 [Leucobacter sp.]
MRRPACGILGATALVISIGLTGCANPVEQITEKIIEDQTGTKIDSDGDGGFTIESEDGKVQVGAGVEKPSDFPSDVPYPNGVLNSSVQVDGGWSLTFEGVDAAEIDRIVGDLTAAGFEETYVGKQSNAFQGNYSADKWTVTLIWDGSDGSSYALVYAVAAR